jgi:hypothetical protein
MNNRASVSLCEKKNCTQRHRGTVLFALNGKIMTLFLKKEVTII